MMKPGKSELSCSVISADPLTFLKNVSELEGAGIDSFHFDVMDGLFVPRLGLYPEYLKMLKSISNLPIEVHLMLSTPEPYLEEFTTAGGIRLIPHIETLDHPIRTFMKISDLGAKAGVAINPGTHLSAVEPLIDFVDSIMLMAINPGVVGHKILGNTFLRISQLKKIVGDDKQIKIIVDGGVTFENAKKLIQAGADSIVCGAGTIFKDQDKVFENTLELRREVDS